MPRKAVAEAAATARRQRPAREQRARLYRRRDVPRISFFYGITIWMYWNEGVHARPHFHARYAGEVASIDFAGG
jgi:Domain of unknown function (DUF4160)